MNEGEETNGERSVTAIRSRAEIDEERARGAYETALALLRGEHVPAPRMYKDITTSVTWHEEGLECSAMPFHGTPLQILKRARNHYERLGWELREEMKQISKLTNRHDFLNGQLAIVESRLKQWVN